MSQNKSEENTATLIDGTSYSHSRYTEADFIKFMTDFSETIEFIERNNPKFNFPLHDGAAAGDIKAVRELKATIVKNDQENHAKAIALDDDITTANSTKILNDTEVSGKVFEDLEPC